MKLIAFFLLLCSICSAQVTVEGTIKDVLTNEPIEIVYITAAGTSVATVSNAEGRFRISVPDNVKQLEFSHLSYKTYRLSIGALKGNAEVYLEPVNIELDEVVVSSKPVNELLKDAVSASKKRLEKALLLNAFFRELVKVDSAYTRFSDGMLDYYVKKANGASELYVKQSRAFRLDNQDMEQNEKTTNSLVYHDIRDAVKDAYNFKEVEQVLKLSNLCTYGLKMKTQSDGRILDIITITPKPTSEYLLYGGTITYDHATNLILDIDIRSAESHKQYSREVNIGFMRFEIFNMARKSVFRLDGEKYVMVYNQNRLDVHVQMGDKYNNNFEFMNDIIVSDYKEGEFELDRKERYKKKTLFDAGTHYDNQYWKSANIMLLTAKEENLIKVLNSIK